MNINNELNKLGDKIIKDAKAKAPIKTGALKRSLEYSIKGSDDSATLTISEISYGQYVNDGTKKMKAQPFMDNAINTNLDKGVDDIAKALTEDILSSLTKIKK